MTTINNYGYNKHIHFPEKILDNNKDRGVINDVVISSVVLSSPAAKESTVDEIKNVLDTVTKQYRLNNKTNKLKIPKIKKYTAKVKNLKRLVNNKKITYDELIKGVYKTLQGVSEKKHTKIVKAFEDANLREYLVFSLDGQVQLPCKIEKSPPDNVTNSTNPFYLFDDDKNQNNNVGSKSFAQDQSGISSEKSIGTTILKVSRKEFNISYLSRNKDKEFDELNPFKVNVEEFDELNPFGEKYETSGNVNSPDNGTTLPDNRVSPKGNVVLNEIREINKKALNDVQFRPSVEMNPDLLDDFDKIRNQYNDLLIAYKQAGGKEKLQSLPNEVATPQGFANYINQQLAKVKNEKKSNLIECLKNEMIAGTIFSQLFELKNINNKYYFHQKIDNTTSLNQDEENKVSDFLRLYHAVVVKEYKGNKDISINSQISSISCLSNFINEKLLVINNVDDSNFLKLIKKIMNLCRNIKLEQVFRFNWR